MASVRDRLVSAGYREVLLPSGVRIRGVMPEARELVRRGLIRADLAAAVLVAERKSDAGEPLSREDQVATIEAQRVEAASFVRQGWNDQTGAWEPLLLTAEDLNDGGMDPRDVDALEDIVLYRRTPEQITASTLEAQGAITEAERELAEREGAGDTVDGWAGFRDERGGADAGPDVADVPDAAVGAAGVRGGSPGRPRARRRTRPAAPDPAG